MRPFLLLLLAALTLAACSSGPDYYKAERLPATEAEQQEVVKKAEELFRRDGDEFEKLVDEWVGDQAVAQKLAMLMVFHMVDAAERQRAAELDGLPVRSLEDNPRYVRARDALGRMGMAAYPTVEELVRHPKSKVHRLHGVEILAKMPVSVLPAIEASMSDCEAKYRRYYVAAVAQRAPSAGAERLLLAWSRHSDDFVRAEAIVGLLAYGDAHLQAVLDAVEKDPDPYVQRHVVKGLGERKGRRSAAVVVQYYGRCVERGDRAGQREAERTLIKMSDLPATKGGKLLQYGLGHWKQWVLTLPVEEGT